MFNFKTLYRIKPEANCQNSSDARTLAAWKGCYVRILFKSSQLPNRIVVIWAGIGQRPIPDYSVGTYAGQYYCGYLGIDSANLLAV